MMPGETQLRAIRMLYRSRGIANVACGGAPFEDSDYTGMRFNQARFANLPLIAEKGLTESDIPASVLEKVDIDGCVEETLPSHHEWFNLQFLWTDVVRTETMAPAVNATKAEVASCLTAGSQGDAVAEESDPTVTYLNNVDYYLSGYDGPDQDAKKQRFSDVYAECAGSYFEALEAELVPERDRMVERHRELLERYAAELSAAGYVP